ncbi:MAG: hypothetical protein SPG52_02665 [Candidatus Cryptobacteroides sp.]|nr:hypothetical protein [Candidatus Cryptobacteroides sp.]
MRKSFIATLALGALVIASCQKENDYAPKAESPVFTASFDTEAPADPDTKTHLVVDNKVKKSHWDSGDVIMVINGENNDDDRAEYTTTDNGASATFNKTTAKSFTGTEFMALYPASPAGSAIWKKDFPEYIENLWLTGTQSSKADSYDPQAHLAYARAVNNTFSFSNMVALLKFTVATTSEKVSSISVTVPEGEYVAGNFNCKVKVGENPMEFYKDKGSTHLSTASLTGKFEAGKSYYLAVLPGDYSALTLSVNGKEFKTKAGKSTFKANSIYNMGTVNGSKTLYLKPNGNWMKDSPWFAVYVFVNDTEYKWVKMEKVGETDVYKAEVPSKYPKVIFCRMKPDSDLNWGNKWNQTSDLIFDATNNCYTVAEETWDKGGGTWSVYKEPNI